MFITKRNGSNQPMQFDKITNRLNILVKQFNIKNIDPVDITRCIAIRLYSGISSEEIDNYACQWLVSKSHESLNYQKLAAVLSVSNLHKETSDNVLSVVDKLYNNTNTLNEHTPLISKQYYDFVQENHLQITSFIDYTKDYNFDYFGLNTLKKSYLIRDKTKKIIERPQHMYLRVACAMYAPNLEKVKQCYIDMNNHLYTHATPTLYNAGTQNQNCASCYLIGVEDSTYGIYKTISDCAQISKAAGGIGIHVHDVRSKGSYINSTGGESNGLLPMLKVFDATARHINQSNKRKGSFAMYLEPHHPDLLSFLHAKRPQGTEEERARDLFYALWVSDLFMERVANDQVWSFMCPNICKGLSEVYGDEYKKLYEDYENKQMYVSQMPARKVWENIITCQIESGVPYMAYKDAANKKSNQKNIGIIKSSNLCIEINQVSTPDEPSVCNLASISLKKMLKPKNITFKSIKFKSKEGCFFCNLLKYYLNTNNIPYEIIDTNENYDIIPADYSTFPKIVLVEEESEKFIGGFTEIWEQYLKPDVDYEKLKNTAYKVTENLNRIIDITDYPLEGAKKTNFERRPLGIGVQGLADMFALLLVDFDSNEAKELNKKIFETIYFGAMEASIDLAKEHGPYDAYEGSPLSNGLLQYDLWGVSEEQLSGLHDWTSLKEKLKQYGARNSLLTALMPTASTSQIMSNNECFEAFTSNLYTRSTNAGDFVMINKYLFEILENTNTWSKLIQDKLVFNRGSVQNISEIPKYIRNVFKTIWEISQKKYIELSAERAPFICQSQSLNLWFKEPNFKTLYKAHMLGWQLGLKTGSYYIRTLPAGNAARLGMNAQTEKELQNEICESCSG